MGDTGQANSRKEPQRNTTITDDYERGMQRAEECVGVGCMVKPREDVASGTRENSAGGRLEHDAVRVLLASLGPAQEGRPCRILENFAHALSRLGRTFQIVLGTNLLRDSHALE